MEEQPNHLSESLLKATAVQEPEAPPQAAAGEEGAPELEHALTYQQLVGAN